MKNHRNKIRNKIREQTEKKVKVRIKKEIINKIENNSKKVKTLVVDQIWFRVVAKITEEQVGIKR
jgi:hypothetical protein